MRDRPLKICVVGTGHIGLPLAALLADAGFEVTGYDTNDDFVSLVNTTSAAGFREEGLDELLAKHLHERLTLTSTPPAGQDVYIITVGTPLETGNQRPNLDRIRVAVQRLAVGFGPNPLVILRSTVSIGTTRNIVLPEILRHTQRFGLAFCPERTIEGKAIPEMRSLPQVVGGLDEESAERAESIFRLITPKLVRVSSLEAAEMIKLINNTYRDLTFAFANEVALIAERMGLSAPEMIHAANVDYPRSNVAQPGFVGGPCLEKDALILIDSLRKIDFKPKVIEEARKINQALPDHDRGVSELGDEVFSRRVAPPGPTDTRQPPTPMSARRLVNLLPKGTKDQLKGWRKRLRLAYVRHRYGFGPDDLLAALRRVGVKAGDVLLVHSSYDKFAGFSGKPSDAIRVLQDAAGATGTVLMSFAKAVIAPRVDGIPEFVRDGETGLLVNPDDPAALVKAMIRLDRDDLCVSRSPGGAMSRQRRSIPGTVS